MLTLYRIAAIPGIVLLLMFPNPYCAFLAGLLFSAAAITDFLDGFYARTRGLESNFGKIMDPLADKILTASAFICLTGRDAIPEWAVILVIAREIRRLADQTAVASLEIEQVVKGMQLSVSSGVMEMDKFTKSVETGVEEIAGVSSQLAEIISSVKGISERFGQVTEGMQAQSQGAEQIRDAMTTVADGAARMEQGRIGAWQSGRQLRQQLQSHVHSSGSHRS